MPASTAKEAKCANPHLAKLQSALTSSDGIGRQELGDALFLLRAHYNLAGIVLCCRRLLELVDQFDWLKTAPDIQGYEACLRVVRAIADLEQVDAHFVAAKISRNKKNETPLRPFSGDSALCDLLLIEPGREAAEEQHQIFSWAQAWFAAQVFRFQVRAQSRTAYDTDVPPILSSTAVWSPIPQTTEVGREEAVFGRTDHRVSA
jgi:hypothetical protein